MDKETFPRTADISKVEDIKEVVAITSKVATISNKEGATINSKEAIINNKVVAIISNKEAIINNKVVAITCKVEATTSKDQIHGSSISNSNRNNHSQIPLRPQ